MHPITPWASDKMSTDLSILLFIGRTLSCRIYCRIERQIAWRDLPGGEWWTIYCPSVAVSINEGKGSIGRTRIHMVSCLRMNTSWCLGFISTTFRGSPSCYTYEIRLIPAHSITRGASDKMSTDRSIPLFIGCTLSCSIYCSIKDRHCLTPSIG